MTPIDILYIEGITDPDLVARVRERVEAIDTDELLQTACLEELIVDEVKEVVTLYESQMEKIESELKNEGINYVNYVGKQENGSLISLLDLTSITLEENVAQ